MATNVHANEMPTFAASSYASQALNLNNLAVGAVQFGQYDSAGAVAPWHEQAALRERRMLATPKHKLFELLQEQQSQPTEQPKKEPVMANVTRVVQVFIADPNDNIPVDDRLLFKGDPKITDLTDQELFFELDIKTLLTAHNEKRTKVVNKLVKDRTEYLEAARVRDLKMTVVTIASF